MAQAKEQAEPMVKQGQEQLPRREEFQKYLEKEGVIEELTKLFVYLYESDRPENALDYIRQFFNQGAQANNDGDSNAKLKNRIEELEKELEEKNAEIEKLRSSPPDNDGNANDGN